MKEIIYGVTTKKITGTSAGYKSMAPAIWSSVIMAVAGMGDALLYAYLPVESAELGISAAMVGVLLSVNKFVRFFTNRLMAFASQWWGIRKILLIGVTTSGITTLIYALNPVLWIWIFARAMWGLAFSSMRFSTIQYAGDSSRTGGALGIGRSIQELGPVLAYWIGPLLIRDYNAELAFAMLGISTLLMLPVSYLLPEVIPGRQIIRAFHIRKPKLIDIWIFLSSFAVEGLMVVGMSKIITLTDTATGNLMVASAFYISLRRLLTILVSPLSGWLSDRWSFKKVFHFSCLLIIAGLLLIAFGVATGGIIIAFIGSAVNITLVPLFAISFTRREKSFDVLTRLSTSRDLGSAFGALSGLSLMSLFPVSGIFAAITFASVLLWLYLFKFEKYNDRDR